MQRKEKEPTSLQLYFPLKGYNAAMSYQEQPLLTTPYCMNVVLTDVSEERARGGSRPALIKAYETVEGGGRPILKIDAITTTYLGADE